MKIFFHVQHLLGIGHLARASRVAAGLARAGHELLLVSGGLPVPGFAPAGVEFLQLPPLRAGTGGFSNLVDQAGVPVDEAFKTRRRAELLAAFNAFAPDCLMTEAFPFGRRQMRFELMPLLEQASRCHPRPLIVVSLRDILQHRTPERERESVEIVKQHYDAVLVHGDRALVRLEESFSLTAEISDKVHYTGLVAPQMPDRPQSPGAGAAPDGQEGFGVVVSAGGGIAGKTLLQAALNARADTHLRGRPWLVLAGINLPDQDWHQLQAEAPPGVRLERHIEDFPAILAKTDVSVSQAGYNTIAETLTARCHPVLVPFAEGGETEQTLRASRLAARGLAEMISPRELTPVSLARAIDRANDKIGVKTGIGQLDLAGAAGTARLLEHLWTGRQAGSP